VGALTGLVELAIVLVAGYLIYITVTQSTRRLPRQTPTGGRWRPHHYASHDG
jgi:hypothetical protein